MDGDPLHLAVEALYATFASYPLRPHIEACDHCHGEEDHRRLASKPLRELTSADLYDYAFSATLTWGDDRDYRHFLPRLFELMIVDSDLGSGPEVVVGHLRHAEWQTWPAGEQSAIRAFFAAWWNQVLEDFPGFHPAGDVLCAIGRVETDLASLIRTWLDSPSLTAAQHLSQFVADNIQDWTTHGTLSNAFWEEHPVPMRQVMEQLLHPAASRRLYETAQRHPDDPSAEELWEAARLLETFRR